jgi:hypothetical protein
MRRIMGRNMVHARGRRRAEALVLVFQSLRVMALYREIKAKAQLASL